MSHARVVSLLSLALAGCWGESLEPNAGPLARLHIAASLGGTAREAVDLNGLRLVLRRSNGDVALDTAITLTSSADSIVVEAEVSLLLVAPSTPPRERFVFTTALAGLPGDTVFRSGPDTVEAVASGVSNPFSANLRYVGVGANAKAVVIESGDTTLFVGDTATITAVALDNAGQAIPGTPIVWSSLDPSIVSVVRSDSGVVTAGGSSGVGRVVAQLLTGPADTAVVRVSSSVYLDFNATLTPGVLHGFSLGPSSQDRGFVLEVTPLDAVAAGFDRSFVQPEWNGTTWNDVLRLQTRIQDPSLQVNVRIYDVGAQPVWTSFNTTLSPAVWHGFALGPSSQDRAFVSEFTPLDDVGAQIAKTIIQPEWNGATYNDVLRVATRAQDPPLNVHMRVYDVSALPLWASFDATLSPGIVQGFPLGPATQAGGFVVEVTPLQDGGRGLETKIVQPEFDGSAWIDVLRLQTSAFDPPILVNIRVRKVR